MAALVDKLVTKLAGKVFQQFTSIIGSSEVVQKSENSKKILDTLNSINGLMNDGDKKPLAVVIRLAEDTKDLLHPILSTLQALASPMKELLLMSNEVLKQCSDTDKNTDDDTVSVTLSVLQPTLVKLNGVLHSATQTFSASDSTLREASDLLKSCKIFVRTLTLLCFAVCVGYCWCRRDALLEDVPSYLRSVALVVFIASCAVMCLSPLWVLGIRADMFVLRMFNVFFSSVVNVATQ